jgi:hypothetical protein
VATVAESAPAFRSRRKSAARLYSSSTGMVEGSIIATIIATHMPANINADAIHPPIGIHTIDIFQPPGIAMAPRMLKLK